MTKELKHPPETQFQKWLTFWICNPALAYLFDLTLASGQPQFQTFHIRIATLFHRHQGTRDFMILLLKTLLS